MRKFLSLFVAVVFVSVAAISAKAAVVASTGPTTAKFVAFAEFAAGGTFSFTLKKAAIGGMPTPADPPATLIDWRKADNTTNLDEVAAGVDGWRSSYVYAELAQDMAPGTMVVIYTDNWNSTSTYKYGSGASSATVNSLVEWANGAGTNNNGLPLLWTIKSQNDLANSVAISTIGAVKLTKLADMKWFDTTTQPSFAVNVVRDKFGTGTGNKFTNVDTVVALVNGLVSGFNVGARDSAYIPQDPLANAWWWGSTPGETYRMFFASNFASARRGFRYVTDTLTIEIKAQP